ncbi:MAG: circularly permuted type 2 ATP-grasp protein [Rhodospirillales bacterium]|nr:circularly permuted type 2 ATP-grasp protein [Rhodospirillales bacterium]
MTTLLSSDTGEPRSLLRSYRTLPGVFDEMMTADGLIRPHWRTFIDSLEAMPEHELADRWRGAARLLHEHGLTYAAEPFIDGPSRPWQLDFVPALMQAGEWRALEAGLIQRARLINAVLADLYGPQRLLRDGQLPSALLFANPHFLRPCHGITPRRGPFIHVYAVDLGRGSDGRWWVLADRTQAPSGVGFALENRIVLSRCLPELFRECDVERLATYFHASHLSLVDCTERENPRIVLLTPGPSSENYFAHAYLARYLGYSLAEGADLTVRDNRVYLKSVDGLKPVDLIVRRVDGDLCDPLELKPDSTVGVAGLLQAARAQTVTIANALGSGVAEAKALMGYLPELCRLLLGEELKIPSIRTLWGGDAAQRAEMLASLDRLAVDSAFKRRPMLARSGGVLAGVMAEPERRALEAAIVRSGHEFVGHEVLTLSTTPTWVDGTLMPRPMTLRMFVAAHGDDYIVLPGGLTRIASTADPRAILLQRGDGTKDTWVLADKPVSGFSLLRTPLSYVEPKRTGKDLPSRAADNLFWLGRQAERCEDRMRILRSVLRRLTEDPAPLQDIVALERALSVLTGVSQWMTWRSGERTHRVAGLEHQVYALLFTPDHAQGLMEPLAELRRTASLVRDRLSLDAWRTLSRLQSDISERSPQAMAPDNGFIAGDTLIMLDDALRLLAAFSGMEMENMTRSHGWRFLDMGRRIERAEHLAKLMQSLLLHGSPEEDGSLLLLLELADSLMTYRSRYLTTPMLPPVLDLLLLDETNPRSVAFQLVALRDHVDQLPRDSDGEVRSREQRLTLALSTELQLAEVGDLYAADATGHRGKLADLLERIVLGLPQLSEHITGSYFSLGEARRPADL